MKTQAKREEFLYFREERGIVHLRDGETEAAADLWEQGTAKEPGGEGVMGICLETRNSENSSADNNIPCLAKPFPCRPGSCTGSQVRDCSAWMGL